MRIGWTCLAVISCLLSDAASAQNSVSLTPSSLAVGLGGRAPFDLHIDFADEALGGGVVLEFDAGIAAFSGFDWDPAFPDDPSLRLVCPSEHPACADFTGPGVLVSFGTDGGNPPSIQGAHRVGSYRLGGSAPGSTPLTLREDDLVAGPFVGTGSFDTPTFSGGQLSVASSIPLPPWLHWALATLLVCCSLCSRRGMRSGLAGSGT